MAPKVQLLLLSNFRAILLLSVTSIPKALPITRRMEFALHSGWGNMNLELGNAIHFARLLGRQLVVPHVMDHFDTAKGSGCENQSRRAERIVHKYADHAPNRPTLDDFLTLNAVAADVVPSAVVWTKQPRSSSVLEQGAKHCCRADLDDKGVLRYLEDARSTCDVQNCTLVTEMCFTGTMVKHNRTVIASLSAVKSKTLAFASLFFRDKPFMHLPAAQMLTQVMAWDTDCEFLAYRPELTQQVKKLLARALKVSSDGTGADGSFDAVHLRLGEGFQEEKYTPCGPNCVTRWPTSMKVLQWLDSRNESRPIYIASDMPSDALRLAKLGLTRRRFFTSANLQVAPNTLFGYLEHEERSRSLFMAPLLLDVLVMVGAFGFFSNTGFYSTFTSHVHRTRVCNALKERSTTWARTPSLSPASGLRKARVAAALSSESAMQLVLATKHIHALLINYNNRTPVEQRAFSQPTPTA